MNDQSHIEITVTFPHSVQRVWQALTDPEVMARWLMPNDFRLELDHEFTLRGPPIPTVGHDGIARCRVLDFAAERFLTISFASDSSSGLDSTVTWTLSPEEGGTRVTLLHHGFDPDNPLHQMSWRMMSSGWPGVLGRLGEEAARYFASE